MTVPSHLAGLISDVDYISEQGLANIEALVQETPATFELGHVQAGHHSVTFTLIFDDSKDPFERGRDVDRILNAAMCIDTLAKNLRAERTSRGPA